jgi:serine/threonine-protein kinase
MAPEQYLRQLTDERTDQFAFAVTAYEALWGQRPFETPSRAFPADLLRTAPRPPPAQGVPAAVWRALSRALEPKAEQRYPTMGELLRELERAMPVRRSRWPLVWALTLPLAAALAFKLAAVDPCTGAATRLAEVWSPEKQEAIGAAFTATHLAYADDAWRAARAGVDGYGRDWQTMYGEACRATRVEGRQSESLMDLRMACLERSRSVLGALGDLWKTEPSADVVRAAAGAVRGLPALEACSDARSLTERAPLPKAPALVAQIALARTKIDQASALNLADRREEAKTAAAAARLEADATQWDQVRAEALFAQGEALSALEETQAEPSLLEAARLAGASRDDRLAAAALITLVHHLGEDKQNTSRALLVADLAEGVLLRAGDDPKLRAHLTRYRGAALYSQGSYAQAREVFGTARALAAKAFGEHDWETTANLAELARVAEAQGDYAEARTLGDQTVAAAIEHFGPNNPTVAALLNNLAMAVDSGGDPEAAVAYHRRALAIKEKALGPESTSTATSLNNLAIILLKLGKLDEGQQMLERALAIREKALGPEHPFVATTLGNLAGAYRRRGDQPKSIELLERSLTLKTKAYGPVHPNVANSLAELGQTYAAAGNDPLALDFFTRALEVRLKVLGPGHQQTLQSTNEVAGSLIALGRCTAARPMLEANLAAVEKLESGKVAVLAEALTLSADCELARARPAAALELLERALRLDEDQHASKYELGEVHWGLGRARWALDQKGPALEAVRAAASELEGDATFARTSSAVKTWLATHR